MILLETNIDFFIKIFKKILIENIILKKKFSLLNFLKTENIKFILNIIIIKDFFEIFTINCVQIS